MKFQFILSNIKQIGHKPHVCYLCSLVEDKKIKFTTTCFTRCHLRSTQPILENAYLIAQEKKFGVFRIGRLCHRFRYSDSGSGSGLRRSGSGSSGSSSRPPPVFCFPNRIPFLALRTKGGCLLPRYKRHKGSPIISLFISPPRKF